MKTEAKEELDVEKVISEAGAVETIMLRPGCGQISFTALDGRTFTVAPDKDGLAEIAASDVGLVVQHFGAHPVGRRAPEGQLEALADAMACNRARAGAVGAELDEARRALAAATATAATATAELARGAVDAKTAMAKRRNVAELQELVSTLEGALQPLSEEHARAERASRLLSDGAARWREYLKWKERVAELSKIDEELGVALTKARDLAAQRLAFAAESGAVLRSAPPAPRPGAELLANVDATAAMLQRIPRS